MAIRQPPIRRFTPVPRPQPAPDPMAGMIRVWPRDETIASLIVHQPGGQGFNAEGGSAIWPNDSFTARRLRDGDVFLYADDAKKAAAAASDQAKPADDNAADEAKSAPKDGKVHGSL